MLTAVARVFIFVANARRQAVWREKAAPSRLSVFSGATPHPAEHLQKSCTLRSARRTVWLAACAIYAPQSQLTYACDPSALISAASSLTSAGVRSVSGGRTGPAPCPTTAAPALTMLTA